MHLTFSPGRLRVLREKAGWTRAFLAHRTQLATSTIQSYEQGKATPSAGALGRLAMALSCTVDDLFVRTDTEVTRVA